MKVSVLKKAQKDLKKIDVSVVKVILLAINSLKDFPNISNIKKLKNHKPIYRKRVGDFRILFDVDADIIYVGRILHRKEAYD